MARWLVLGLLVGCASDVRRIDASVDGAAADSSAIDAPFRDVVRLDVPGEVCETVSAVAEPLPPTVLFQMDTSNSMNCRADDFGCLTDDPTPAPDDSRWDVFVSALVDAVGSFSDASSVGLMRFPRAEGACARDEFVSDFTRLSDGRAGVVAAARSIVPDGLSTPTHDAVAFGVGRLSGVERPALVLATDGDARVCFGCDTDCAFDDPSAQDRDNDALVERVRAAAAAGVPTFVIGVPGSAGYRPVLSRLASAAGTARAGCSDSGPTYCHYDLTDPALDFGAALRDAFAAIGEAVLECVYEIPDNPDGAFDPGQVNVRIQIEGGDESIPRDPARGSGWDYSDDMTQIELFGAACDRARMADALDILFGCPTILI